MNAENTLTEEKTEFKFDELSERAKRRAVSRFECYYDEWWDSTYAEAAEIGLTITSFDLDRSKHAKGKIEDMSHEQSARLVMESHGKDCGTHKAALAFASHVALMDESAKFDDNGEKTEEFEELCETYLKELLENYADMLQSESDHLNSEESISETIRANDCTFDEDGNQI